jgi:hypothetical protein
MYSQYRTTELHDGLLEDKRAGVFGFQGIQVQDHLCASVPGHDRKVKIVGDRETIEKRLRAVLR